MEQHRSFYHPSDRAETLSKQGWLTKQGGRVKNWKRRWFVIRDNRMYYYKSAKEQEPQGFIPIEQCCVRFVSNGKKNCVEIYDPRGPFTKSHPSFFVYADSEEELISWVQAINMKSNAEVHLVTKSPNSCLKEGYLLKRSGMVKNWKKRWFTLSGNTLAYYREKGEQEPMGFILMDQAALALVDERKFSKPFCFEITDQNDTFTKWHKSYILAASSKSELDEWNQVLNECILQVRFSPEVGSNKSEGEQRFSGIVLSDSHERSSLRGRDRKQSVVSDKSFTNLSSSAPENIPLNKFRLKSRTMSTERRASRDAPPLDRVKSRTMTANTKNLSNKKKKDQISGSCKGLPLPAVIIKMVSYLDSCEVCIEDLQEDAENSKEDEMEAAKLKHTLKEEVYSEDMIDGVLEEYSPPVVAKLLLSYFEKLFLQPVLTFQLSEDLIASRALDSESQQRQWRIIITERLPKPKQKLLEYLLAFIGRIEEREEMLFPDKSIESIHADLALIFGYFIVHSKKYAHFRLDNLKQKMRKATFESLDKFLTSNNNGDLEANLLEEMTLDDKERYIEEHIQIEIIQKMLKEYEYLFISFLEI
eukprot:TRINITY_DN8379_c0_g1_i1.p1 TRINITY_DN8379_c0_g1~~TRINITY_DN8379_c0_g1_i1.p1  ORF type:complete len:588 (-),score=142.77 TRINITY_DN8379_c0_g1_i1:130-1893(-)